MSIPNRADDEKLLTAIRLRCEGKPMLEVSKGSGIKLSSCRPLTDLVRRADLEESGEPRGLVLRHYPWS